jgi:hypothetical protein
VWQAATDMQKFVGKAGHTFVTEIIGFIPLLLFVDAGDSGQFDYFSIFCRSCTNQRLETAKRLSSSSTVAHSNYFRKFVQKVVPFLQCAHQHETAVLVLLTLHPQPQPCQE